MKKYVTFMIIFTEIFVIIFAIVSSLEMYSVLVSSSYCYPNPNTKTLDLISQKFDANRIEYKTASYYITCKGMSKKKIDLCCIYI